MCTVSWVRQDAGYTLFCNRDERRTRKPALGPRRSVLRGVAFIAPVDGDQGGSWIAVNEFGLTLCLLNRYEIAPPERDRIFTSRGLLLTSLIAASSCREVRDGVTATELGTFQPFTLAVTAVGEPELVLDWNGSVCQVRDDAENQRPLVSSSLKNPEIGRTRRAQFDDLRLNRGRVDPELLNEFHRSHLPERGPYSVCMHRDDAVTVSLSVVKVQPELIEFVYHPASPCETTAEERVTIDRRAPPMMADTSATNSLAT